LLHNSKITYSQIEKLIIIFLDNKTAKDAYDILSYDFLKEKININKTRRYLTLFSQVVLEFYDNYINSTILEGEIELDESHLSKVKDLKLVAVSIS